MKRLLHIALLILALLGLVGQSTAMAMAPPRSTAAVTDGSMNISMQASMADMDCMDMATAPAPGKPPCKKVTLQCIAAMGCSPLALTEPSAPAADTLPAAHDRAAPLLAARLYDRSFGPEPDPPPFLI